MASSSAAGQARWELENAVQSVSQSDYDALYRWDPAQQRELQQERPWDADRAYFKSVRISALAVLKMAIHARSGGDLEVMGVMQGKVLGNEFVVLDAFPLPVEGTETRVNAQAEAYEYMVEFLETSKAAGKPENIVGWYHSHPGYGCWLSGIDVGTQMTNQRYQEPFLAVVIDPHRTEAAGKVELGAFRTYPEGSAPAGDGQSGYQSVPLEKIEDYGVHANQYYPLEVSYFKSRTDEALLSALWSSYWVRILSSAPLAQARSLTVGRTSDIARKLANLSDAMSKSRPAIAGPSADRAQQHQRGGSSNARSLQQISRDAAQLAEEELTGLASLCSKRLLLSRPASRAAGLAPMELS
ncbi:hypothetical protein QBZ16_003753 [Prototheca wickerhamii]|uniref:MPN domain-containing protein n=1 Tax=Prototheca wickerhamii TaxID=3111 RepID=A0AAD9IJQ2_PROWI|nr:hypothetical protein QBZ16_003753 [Prototheca wickerhamii]